MVLVGENATTKTRFAEILKEYGFKDDQIDDIWENRPTDDLDDEERIRYAAEQSAKELGLTPRKTS